MAMVQCTECGTSRNTDLLSDCPICEGRERLKLRARAEDPNEDPGWLGKLAISDDPDTAEAALRNPSTPEWAIRRAARQAEESRNARSTRLDARSDTLEEESNSLGEEPSTTQDQRTIYTSSSSARERTSLPISNPSPVEPKSSGLSEYVVVKVGTAIVLAVFAASFFIAALLRAYFDASLYLQACLSDEGLEGAPGRVANSICAPFNVSTPTYFLVMALLLAVAAATLLYLARPRRARPRS